MILYEFDGWPNDSEATFCSGHVGTHKFPEGLQIAIAAKEMTRPSCAPGLQVGTRIFNTA